MPDNVVKMKKRRTPGLLLWLMLFILLLGGVLLFIIGQTRIKQVIVSGSVHYNQQEVADMAGVTKDTTILDVLMGRLDIKQGLPYIEEVDIEYLSFNSIHIKVTEKEVISYLPYQGQYLALDKDGYIVGYEDEKVVDLPSITGLYFEQAVLGQPLDVSDEVLQALLAFYHLGDKYGVALDEVIFQRGDGEMLLAKSGAVTVVFGNAYDLDRKMKDAREVLDKLDLTVAGTLDLQADTDRYIFKEAIGARYYVPYGERFLAVAKDGTVKKISVHRMQDQPLITGIAFSDPKVNELMPADPGAMEVVATILDAGEYQGLTISEVIFGEGDPLEIIVVCQGVRLLLGEAADLDLKMAHGANVFFTLEEGVYGEVDLRKDQEIYEFSPDESP